MFSVCIAAHAPSWPHRRLALPPPSVPQSQRRGERASASDAPCDDDADVGPSARQTSQLEENEGFTRSISLYWRWVKGQKGAARIGKVRCRRHEQSYRHAG